MTRVDLLLLPFHTPQGFPQGSPSRVFFSPLDFKYTPDCLAPGWLESGQVDKLLLVGQDIAKSHIKSKCPFSVVASGSGPSLRKVQSHSCPSGTTGSQLKRS